MTGERFMSMSEADRLAWVADDLIADLRRQVENGQPDAAARLAHFEAVKAKGDLANDAELRIRARTGRPPNPAVSPASRVAAFIEADPELKALVADTEALAAEAGVALEPSTGSGDPSTVAEAIRAAAVCLASDIVA